MNCEIETVCLECDSIKGFLFIKFSDYKEKDGK